MGGKDSRSCDWCERTLQLIEGGASAVPRGQGDVFNLNFGFDVFFGRGRLQGWRAEGLGNEWDSGT